MDFFEKINGFLRRFSDLILAVFVVLIVAMLVIPIPTGAMDFVLALNISIAALMLLVALYIPQATRIPSFPTILLLTTLFRLALNVSTTRLILLQADAGKIIFAFGDFVVGGNYVVGAVIFLILVLIQFIVIAKGSERVAEVSARFTLDAMPGKQTSIDADLRNGIIDATGAMNRRRALEKESQLYGAMDGAMKFVKGDAIAGIIISIINIVGGLVVGVLQQGMSLSEAAELYSLLTIGDGLVSQIPALLMSISAGLVVTRVASASGDEDSNIARDVFDQVLENPRAVALVSVLLFSMAWLPSFPRIAFLVLALVFGLMSIPRLGLFGKKPGAEASTRAGEKAKTQAKEMVPAPHPSPLSLEIHQSLLPLFLSQDEEEQERIEQQLAEVSRLMYIRTGVTIPPITRGSIRARLGRLSNSYTIEIFECSVANGMFSPDSALIDCEPRDAMQFGIEALPAKLPWSRSPACIVAADLIPRARAANLTVYDAREVIVRHLTMTLRKHAADFLGIEEVGFLLDRLKRKWKHLVQAVTPTHLNLQQVTEVLQRLLREEVPIRDLRKILESLAKWGVDCKDPLMLTEFVRRDMKRVLCSLYTAGHRRLGVFLLDQEIEQTIAAGISKDSTGRPILALAPETHREILEAVEQAVRSSGGWRQPLVILTSATVRRYLKSVLETSMSEVAVMSSEELAPDVEPRWLGRISFQPPTASAVGESS